ncbi:MAG TPA: hypothetical protein VGQ75_05695 [Thermoanaerobaculia bacterium]|jgi:hypothetical protein|nr:hypothetical protein [Thermoanaerobaculia bacterium]
MKSPEPLDEIRLGRALAALDSGHEPELPDPAVLWRRAQLFDALEARRRASRPVQVAHAIAIALTVGALALLAASRNVFSLEWIARSSSGLALTLTLSLFLLGAALILATGAAAGRNLSRRAGGSATD